MEDKLRDTKTTAEIAKQFGVTVQAVGLWIKNGLPYTTERIVGRKARRIISPDDVVKFLGLTKKEKR